MSPVTDPPPLQLIVGARGHGVVEYAVDIASALEAADSRTQVALVGDVAHAIRHASVTASTHVHVTDGLLGRSPEEAALNLERLAAVTRLTITGHDLPQTSDGTTLPRRAAAYTRFFTAADATLVNSRHEQQLVADFLPGVARPHAIPLGSRVAAVPQTRAAEPIAGGARDLVVLIAGYIYPGKGHAQAIRAAAEAADSLRAAGDSVGACALVVLPLLVELRTGRRVRAVDVCVAGDASSPHGALVGMQPGGERVGRMHVIRMAQARMALLAQERNRRDQQGLLVRPVRRVAVEATLAHGRVFEQERPAFLRVTLVAGLVDRVRLQQRAGDRAVRIVAIVAAHLAFGQRHVRTPVELQAHVAMTLRASVVDRCLRHQAFG